MPEEQRKHLEGRLLEERERVLRSLQRYEQDAGVSEQDQDGDLSRVPLHLADEGTDTMQQELDASLATRDTQTLYEIDDALRRLYHDPGRFGRCERTGEEIPFERLDIIPWARTCDEAADDVRA
jgi:RNA polymerase-binding transcription factor DksA